MISSLARFATALSMMFLLGMAAHAQEVTFVFTPTGSSDPTHAVGIGGNPAKDSSGSATVDGVGGRFWYRDEDGTIYVMNGETLQIEFIFDDGCNGPTGNGSNGGTSGTWVNIDYS